MQQVFKNALFHEEPTVLRRRLLPLCCGHVMTLMCADNPYFVESGEKPNLMHLAFAAGVCSRTHEEGEKWITSEKLFDEVKKWGKSCRKMNYAEEGAKFQKYVIDYAKFPERWSKKKNPDPCGHPWPLLIVVTLMPLVGESRAWNMPLTKAISLWSAYQETQGDDSLKKDWEINALTDMKKKQAKESTK